MEAGIKNEKEYCCNRRCNSQQGGQSVYYLFMQRLV